MAHAGGGRTLAMVAGTFAAGLAATLAACAAIWNEAGGVHYNGADGKLYQTLVANALAFASPITANLLNPLQGMFTQQIPTNAWLNPAYAVFRVAPFETGLVLSAAVAYLCLALSSFILALTCRVRPAAATAGALAAIVAFPPFHFALGLNSQYSLVPATAFTLALETLALVVVVCAGRLAPSSLAGWSLALAAVTAWTIVADPMYVLAGLLALAPCGAVLFFADAARPRLLARAIVLAAAAAMVFLSGLVEYLGSFVAYTARYHFAADAPRHTLPGYASSILAHPVLAGPFFAVMMLGAALGLLATRGRVRLLLLAVLFQWLTCSTLGAAYLFSGVDWILPLPLYLEQGAYHLYALAGVVGWSALLAKALILLGRGRVGASGAIRFGAAAAAGALAVPFLLVGYLREVSPQVRGVYAEPWPRQTELVAAVASTIGPEPNGRFRGSVAVSQDYTYSAMLRTIDLWRHGIPTVNEYSQLLTPPLFHLASRLLTRNPGISVMNGFFIADPRRTAVMSLMGARFLVTTAAIPLENAATPAVVDAGLPHADYTWYLRELADPNLGQYSPTEIVRVRTAAEALERMDAAIDFRRQAVVLDAEPVPPLVQATRGEIFWRNGRIRVSARAPGHALVVLPVQFSRCLRIVGGEKGGTAARLIRADLALTGLLFEHSAELELVFDFGFLSSRCRLADLSDLDAIDLKPRRGPKPFDRAAMMPYAIDRLDLAGAKLRLLWQDVERAAAVDRQSLHLFCGPICRSLSSGT